LTDRFCALAAESESEKIIGDSTLRVSRISLPSIRRPVAAANPFSLRGHRLIVNSPLTPGAHQKAEWFRQRQILGTGRVVTFESNASLLRQSPSPGNGIPRAETAQPKSAGARYWSLQRLEPAARRLRHGNTRLSMRLIRVAMNRIGRPGETVP
jgi:hypothetical protein